MSSAPAAALKRFALQADLLSTFPAMAKRTPCNNPNMVVGTMPGTEEPGGCYQHKKASEETITIRQNVTKVPDYAETPDPAGIAPYPRPTPASDTPSCGTYESDCVPPEPPCGPWTNDMINGGSEWDSALSYPTGSGTPVYLNYYEVTEDTVDMSTCRKIGHKVVQARKTWHGLPGFKSEARNAPNVVTNDSSCNPSTCRGAHLTPDQTRYLTLTGSCTLRRNDYSVEEETIVDNWVTRTCNATASVNRYSGIKTTTCTADDPCDDVTFYNFHPNGTPATLPLPSQTTARLMLFAAQTWDVNSLVSFMGYPGVLFDPDADYTCTGTSWIVERIGTEEIVGYYFESNADLNAGTASISYDQDDWSNVYDATLSVSNTSINWTLKTYTQVNVAEDVNVVVLIHDHELSLTLSDPYTAAQLFEDCKELLAEWPLNDDKLLPWRQDGSLTVGPLVTRNEPNSAVIPTFEPRVSDTDQPIDDCEGRAPSHEEWSPTYEQVEWTDPNTRLFDGSILGSPLPAGTDKHFDFRHETWKWCFNSTTGIKSTWIAKPGAWSGQNTAGDSTDTYVPGNCTQWTNNAQAAFIPPGAGIYFFGNQYVFGDNTQNLFGADVLVMQKTAQTKVPRPSENFARPCGTDRFALEEDRVECVHYVDETTPSAPLVGTQLSGHEFEVGEKVLLIAPDSSSSGVWEVSSIPAAHEVILGSKVCDLPTGLPPRCQDGLVAECAGSIGPLKWFNKPGFCGRIEIESAVQNGGVVDITVATPIYLVAGDHLDFTNTGSLGSNVEVASVGSTSTFSVTGTLGTYTSGGSMTVHGAPSEDWNDNEIKGDLVYIAWEQTNRDWREQERLNGLDPSSPCYSADPLPRQQQADNGFPHAVTGMTLQQIGPAEGTCIPFSVCNPQVFAISPNGETWPNGVTKPFPSSFTVDATYGAQWQADFIQHWPSIFDEVQQKLCIDDGVGNVSEETASQDNGSCAVDELSPPRFYVPHVPMVEARISPPLGAPTPPAGYGFMTLAEIQSATPPDKVALAPWDIARYSEVYDMPPGGFETPWQFFQLQKGCKCAGGRFDDQYAAQMVECDRICPPEP